jgi:hypothetical protein
LLYLAAGPVYVVKDHFVVLRRIQGRRKRGALTMGLWTVAELAGAVVGALLGGTAMLLVGWLVMSSACAIFAFPVLLKAISKKPRHDNVEAAASATVSSRGDE